MDKTILITGGCGFVGSNLSVYFKEKYPSCRVIAMDNLKRRGSELNIVRLKEAGVTFLHGDIRNREDFSQVGNIDLIIEASAEPSVLGGINSSLDYLINTNLIGTINCLQFAAANHADFIFLSTSRVYPFKQLDTIAFTESPSRFEINPNQEIQGVSPKGIAENFPLGGARSFYGATKLASELMVQEFNELMGMNTVINRCGVLTGPYQMGKVDQGFVVLWVARHFWKKKLAYIGYGGDGKQVRDILHIHDFFRLIDEQVHNIGKYNGEVFNVGGGPECAVSLRELTTLCEQITGNKIEIETNTETRVADVRLFITDQTRVTGFTGWKPEKRPVEIVRDVYDWILRNEKALEPILNQ